LQFFDSFVGFQISGSLKATRPTTVTIGMLVQIYNIVNANILSIILYTLVKLSYLA